MFWVVWLVLVGVVVSFLFVGLGASYWSVFLPRFWGFYLVLGCVCWWWFGSGGRFWCVLCLLFVGWVCELRCGNGLLLIVWVVGFDDCVVLVCLDWLGVCDLVGLLYFVLHWFGCGCYIFGLFGGAIFVMRLLMLFGFVDFACLSVGGGFLLLYRLSCCLCLSVWVVIIC